MNGDETTAKLNGIICKVGKHCCVDGFGALSTPGGAFEPQSNE